MGIEPWTMQQLCTVTEPRGPFSHLPMFLVSKLLMRALYHICCVWGKNWGECG